MLKKFILFLLVVAMLFTLVLTGCNKAEEESNGKINVVSTIFPQYDFSRQIAGDNANLKMLIPPAGESHTYEPTPQDIISIENSDVFLYIGGENDKWVDNILDSVDTNKTKVVKLIDYVDAVDEEIVEGMQEHAESYEETHDEIHSKDEHIWTSPINAISMVNAISSAMCDADKKNSNVYKKNAKNYISELEKLDIEFRSVIDSAKRNEIVFGDRFPLRYFTDEYDLDYYAAFPGCSSETEPSAATIAFLTDKVKKDKIPVILKIELSNGVVANTIAEETNTKVMTFYSCHNLTKEQFENGETYLSMMTKNVATLKVALE